jgi:TPP-dependent pyruvate/acetoin dehydrogenase alpha subunit
MDQATARELYVTMVRIREFEEAVGNLFYRGKIPGFVHLYIGEEAIAAGVCATLRKDDCITSTHRGHGHVLAKGGDTKRMMAEIFGRSDGYGKGKGGSMHLADLTIGVLGANGVLAGGVGIATGVGLAASMKGEDRVAVAFLGDAAANQGILWESLNLAGLWKLPVVYVVENNGFSEYTPSKELTSSLDFAARAKHWGGVAGANLDGNDVDAVYQAAQEAVDRARAGEGPTLLNCHTYRWKAHNEGEEAVIGNWSYRTREELEAWQGRDPIARFELQALDRGWLTQEQMDALHAEVEKEMQAAVAFAEQSPLPKAEEAFQDVFAG